MLVSRPADSHPLCYAVVPAAGVGRRMGGAVPKQYLQLLGRPVLRWSLESLLAHPRVAGAVVAISSDDTWWPELATAMEKPVAAVAGGVERAHSVLNALEYLAALPRPPEWVLVHDAVRPCITRGELDTLLERALESPDGALLAAPVRDTLKRQDAYGRVDSTSDRNGLWHALTPQCFPLLSLREALARVLRDGQQVTDEAQAMELQGFHPVLVEGRSTNVKLTRPADLALLESILRAGRGGGPP